MLDSFLEYLDRIIIEDFIFILKRNLVFGNLNKYFFIYMCVEINV